MAIRLRQAGQADSQTDSRNLKIAPRRLLYCCIFFIIVLDALQVQLTTTRIILCDFGLIKSPGVYAGSPRVGVRVTE